MWFYLSLISWTKVEREYFSNSAGDFDYSGNNIKYWLGPKKAVTEYKNFEVQFVKSEVENCHCYISLHKMWVTTMETDEITPLQFTIFINILAKNIDLVIHG